MWQRHPRRAWARREDPRCKVGRHADDRDALLPVAPCAPGTAQRVKINCRYAMSPFFWGGFQMAATQSGAMPLSDEDPRRQPAEREQQRPRIGENCSLLRMLVSPGNSMCGCNRSGWINFAK